jgi:peptide/nickel transport system ATP-binding protein
MNTPLLTTTALDVRYGTKLVVNGLSLQIQPGEAVGVIGESGSGKSMTALAILGLLPPAASVTGSIRYRDAELNGIDEQAMRALRGRRIAMIFQDPMSSLNPLMTVGAQIVEALRAHIAITAAQARERACALLDEVGLPQPEQQLRRHPFELSGGQQQRVMIAMALACEPELLIADEPTTALDVSTQAQVLALLRKIQRARGMAMLFVSHDLDAVTAVVDRVAVMRGGELLECGPVDQVMHAPRHAYTRSLLDARPVAIARRAVARPTAERPAIELSGVCIDYAQGRQQRRVVHDVSLQLADGAALGIVGESGSGKSTLARAIMGMLTPASGQVKVLGHEPADRARRLAFARECQFVFQDTSGSLNPRRTIAQALAEPQQIHTRSTPAEMARRSAALLNEVGMDAALLTRYPHQLSGGQRQRVVIARALANDPRILVCDEPVSALDASVRAQVLALIARLRRERALTLVFIGHDLGVMQSVAETTMVLQGGRVIEYGDTHEIFSSPQHAYTQALMAAGSKARSEGVATPGRPCNVSIRGAQTDRPQKVGIQGVDARHQRLGLPDPVLSSQQVAATG